MPRFIQNAFFGGISGDQFVGIKNSLQSIKNLTFRNDSKMIKLSDLNVRNASGVIVDFVKCFLTVQSNGDVIAFGDAGKIYVQTAGTGSFVLKYTDSSARGILSCYEYNGYIYWTTSGKLHRIASSFSHGTWAGNVTENFQTFTNGNTSYHPMIEVYNTLYIGDGSLLASYDSDLGAFTANQLSIFGDEEIVSLTFNGSRIKIYSHRTSSVEYGRCYMWDAVSQSYNEFISWQGLMIHGAVSILNNDFIIAGKKPSLYTSNGYSIQPLKRLPGFDGSYEGVISNNAITTGNGYLYFGSIFSGTSNANRGVWSYGAKDKDYPYTLNNETTTTNGNASDLIGAVHFAGSKIYSSWKNGSTYGIDVTDNTQYSTTGEFITRVWDGGAGYQKKIPTTLKMSFRQLASGEKIEVYMRRDLTSSWGSVVLSADYSYTPDSGVTYPDRSINFKELSTNDLGTVFNFIEFKVVLTGPNTTSPSLSELIFDADFVQVQ